MIRFLHGFALGGLLACLPLGALAEPHHPVLVLGPAGTATAQPDTLSVAAPLANVSKHAATHVQILRFGLDHAQPITPTPILVGTIPAGSNVLVQAVFDSQRLRSGQTYEFVVFGRYRGRDRDDEHGDWDRRFRDDDDEHEFRAEVSVTVPPLSDGSATLGSVQIPPLTVQGGGFAPQPPQQDADVNSGAPTVPTNPTVPGVPTPTGTQIMTP